MLASSFPWHTRVAARLVACMALVGACLLHAEPIEINVRDFGAVGDGVTDDSTALSQAIDALEQRGRPARLIFPEGSYYLGTPMSGNLPPRWENQQQGPELRAHLLLINQRNVTIQGEGGAELICGDLNAHGVLLGECENVAVENLAIAYRPLPYAQGRALAVDPKGRWIDWRADAGHATPERADFFNGQQAHWFVVFDPETRQRRNDVYRIRFTKMERRDDGVFRLFGRANGFPASVEGCIVLITSRRTSHALYAHLGKDIRCDNVTIHSSPGLAFHAMFTSNFQVRNSRIGAKPGSDQLLATCADGLHVKMTEVGPTLENCHFTQLDDDAINVNSTYIRVIDQLEPRVLLTDVRPDIVPGVELGFLDPNTMMPLGEARVESARIQPGPHVPFLRVTLDRDIAVEHTVRGVKDSICWGPPVKDPRHEGPRPTLICNRNAVNRGTRIAGNTFEDINYRGVVINAEAAVIADNTFSGLLGPGVQTGNDLSWYEGPASCNLAVTGNRFERIANSSVYTAALDLHHEESDALRIDGLTLTDNVFEAIGARPSIGRGYGLAGHVVDLNNTDGVTITDNRFSLAASGPSQGAPIALNRSAEVVVSDNVFAGFPDESPVLAEGGTSGVEVRDNTFESAKAE